VTKANLNALLILPLLAACNQGGESPAASAPAAEPEPTTQPAAAAPPAEEAAQEGDEAAQEEAEGDEHAAHAEDVPVPADMPAVPAGAKISFVAPDAGATIEGRAEEGTVEVALKMGADGIAVKPAGEIEVGSGHHHIIIDQPGVPRGQVVPKDASHVHFGKGQTETTLALAPGKHTLTLQFADGAHRSYGEALRASIEVTVVDTTPPGEKVPAGKAPANAPTE
jgi:hypothetical protein